MPPYVKSEFIQYVCPFYESKSEVNSVELHSENGGQFFSGRPSNSYRRDMIDRDMEDRERPRNITSTARFSYMLDRFERNALLIINSSREVDNTMRNLSDSFQRYRFEANIIEANKKHEKREVLRKIKAFFEQDFTEIGAVAVVFLTSTRFKAFAGLRNGKLEEQDLMQYFTFNQPIGLRGKPKIFIKEGICITEDYPANEIPASMNFEDVLIIQANILYHATNLRPLDLLCAHLNNMKRENLLKELHMVVCCAGMLFATKYTISMYSIMQYKTTLTRELLLERSDESSAPVFLIKPSKDDVEENLATRVHIRKRSKKMLKHFYSKLHMKNALNPGIRWWMS